jgi:hypothetical protein
MKLDRNTFREQVFKRDKGKCVMCGENSVDAHHIIERKLWLDGGYYLDNGVSLCESCHIKAEQTLISCEELREKAEIKNVLLPEHFNLDEKYDKWGNVVLTNGMRLKGEMFFEEQVQKMLKSANLLNIFLNYVKYPRTMHFPWSPNLQNDDRMMQNTDFFSGKEIVITVKMDGENTNMYKDRIHARSLETDMHESRTWVRALWGNIKHELPDGWRICGENMYAEHSIHYKNLSTYFYVFSIWNEKNECLSWDETILWCQLLNLEHVPIIFRGIWNEEYVKSINLSEFNGDNLEGYVCRIVDKFSYSDYKNAVGKCVRKNHVTTDQHWMKKQIVKNEIKK